MHETCVFVACGVGGASSSVSVPALRRGISPREVAASVTAFVPHIQPRCNFPLGVRVSLGAAYARPHPSADSSTLPGDRALRHSAAMTRTLPEDVESWRRTRDEAAARRLVEALYPQVIRIVRNHLPFRTGEEDLAQEVFVQLFKTLDRYDASKPLENWVSRLALNVCLNALRSRRRRPELRWSDLSEDERAVVDSLLHAPEDAPDAGSGAASDTRALLLRLLDSLGAEDRLVITLLHLEEKSLKEIQALTGWGSVVVRMRAYRARKRLRKMIEELESGSVR